MEETIAGIIVGLMVILMATTILLAVFALLDILVDGIESILRRKWR